MSEHRGFLIPPWYSDPLPSADSVALATGVWGFTLGTSIFSASTAVKHTWKSWRRLRRINAYVVMIWLEWAVCVSSSIVLWAFIRGRFGPSFELFFSMLVMWAIQVQTILQIIINRIGLLLDHPSQKKKLAWSVAFIIALVNISVFIIWIPARLQISSTYEKINHIWDRIEKVIFLVVDASLNLYFIYLVRSRLIAGGLKKYDRLFKFNVFMVIVSICLDITLIAAMSLHDTILYIQFHPLVYGIKLHIELKIAELIGKVVKASNLPTFASTAPLKLRPCANLSAKSGTVEIRYTPNECYSPNKAAPAKAPEFPARPMAVLRTV